MQHIIVALAETSSDVSGDGLIEKKVDRSSLAGIQQTMERFFQILDEDDAEDLEIAHYLRQRPAGFPALLAVPLRPDSWRRLDGIEVIGEILPDCLEQARQAIEKGFVMNADSLPLLPHGALHPPSDENIGIALDYQADLDVLIGAK